MRKITTVIVTVLLIALTLIVALPAGALGAGGKISVGLCPTAVAVDPSTNTIYVSNTAGNSVSVIDGNTQTVVATIPIGASPSQICVNASTRMVYVVIQDHILVISGASNTVVATIPLEGVVYLDVNPNTNKVYASFCIFDPFNPPNEFGVAVIGGASNTVIKTIEVLGMMGGVSVNLDSNEVYAAASKYIESANVVAGTVITIDGSTDEITAESEPLELLVGPLCYNPATNLIYVVHPDTTNMLSVVSAVDNTVVDTIPFDKLYPSSGICVNPDTNRIYVSDQVVPGNILTVIDGVDNTVMKEIEVGYGPMGVDINPETGILYVCNYTEHTVSYVSDPPKIASVIPASGTQGQTLDVQIAGTDTMFAAGISTAAFSGTGITVNSTTVTDSAHATANITIAADAPTGARDVNVETTGEETPIKLEGGFTVYEATPATASIAGAGWTELSGVYKNFHFDAAPGEEAPTGNMAFYDFANIFCPILIESTSYDLLSIPDGASYGMFSGTCNFNGQPGYRFTVVGEDLGGCFFWIFNNVDKIHICVQDSTGAVVYASQSVVWLGDIVVSH